MADEMVELALGGARRDEGNSRGKITRLRGAIHQTNTETGRLAMEEPNLQTVPKPRTFRMADAYDGRPGMIEEGRAEAQSREPSPGTEAGSEETLSVRNAFVVPPGAVLLSADYRQLELRVMAHMSGDEGLVQAFNHEGVPPHHPDADPFRFLASRWQGVEKGKVSDADRAVAKQVSDEQSPGFPVTRFPTFFLSTTRIRTEKGLTSRPLPKMAARVRRAVRLRARSVRAGDGRDRSRSARSDRGVQSVDPRRGEVAAAIDRDGRARLAAERGDDRRPAKGSPVAGTRRRFDRHWMRGCETAVQVGQERRRAPGGEHGVSGVRRGRGEARHDCVVRRAGPLARDASTSNRSSSNTAIMARFTTSAADP